MTPKQRFQQAHYEYKKKHFTQLCSDGFYTPPKMPKINTANGLTQFIVKFIDWSGGHANRISSAGRFLPGNNKFEGGTFIPGTTKRGTADIAVIINGKAIMLEVKVGKDRPSEAQLNQQASVRAAGGIYEFVSNPEQFFELFDSL